MCLHVLVMSLLVGFVTANADEIVKNKNGQFILLMDDHTWKVIRDSAEKSDPSQLHSRETIKTISLKRLGAAGRNKPEGTVYKVKGKVRVGDNFSNQPFFTMASIYPFLHAGFLNSDTSEYDDVPKPHGLPLYNPELLDILLEADEEDTELILTGVIYYVPDLKIVGKHFLIVDAEVPSGD